MHPAAPRTRHFLAGMWRRLTRVSPRVQRLVRPLEHLWKLPAGLSAPLEIEWRLVAIRWFGVLLMYDTPDGKISKWNPSGRATATSQPSA